MKYDAPGSITKQIYRYILSDINRLIDMVLFRFLLYVVMLYAGYLLLQSFFEPVRVNVFSFLKGNHLFDSALALFMFTFPAVTFNWLLKNRDTLRQSRQMLDQQNEGLFANALQLLFKKDDKHANSAGLKELIRLKRNKSIDSARIDLITAELDLKGVSLNAADLQEANLQEAKLQNASLSRAILRGANLLEANLQDAILPGADLQGADLQGADLQGADLKGANLQDANLEGVKNLHPDMLRKAKNWRKAILDSNLRQQAEEADKAG